MSFCPRCQGDEKTCRVEHEGHDHQGNLVWTVYYCESCAFTWRNSEPEESIVYTKRDPFSRVDVERDYPVVMPPPSRD
jgi:vanillate/4-hydroxybenzoate decarboxylase subunit D